MMDAFKDMYDVVVDRRANPQRVHTPAIFSTRASTKFSRSAVRNALRWSLPPRITTRTSLQTR